MDLKSKLSVTELFNLENEAQRLNMFKFFLWVMIVIYASFFTLYLFIENPYIAWRNLGVIGCLLIAIWNLKYPKRAVWIIHTIIALCSAHLFSSALRSGNTASPYLILSVIIPLTALFFTSNKGFAFWTTMTGGAILYLLYLDISGSGDTLSTTILLTETPYSRLLSFVVIIIISCWWFNYYGQAINKAFSNALRSNEQLSNLVRLLGHDIAGPIMVIDGYSNMIKGSPDNPKLAKHIEAIKKNTEAISILVEKINELNQIENGERKIDLVPVDLEKCTNLAAELMRERCEAKNINIRISNNTKNAIVLADPQILAYQVLPNLIGNANKFSDPGSVIDIVIDEEHNFFTLMIKDYGMGIPEDILQNIFSYTKKTTRPGTGGEKGTGFGMPLVKNFIEKMKGSISISSRTKNQHPEDHGTIINISFAKTGAV